MADSSWFRVDLVPVHFTIEIGLQFAQRSTCVDVWFIGGLFKV